MVSAKYDITEIFENLTLNIISDFEKENKTIKNNERKYWA